MSSVYNSLVISSDNDSTVYGIGRWEDVQGYASVLVDIASVARSGATPSTCTVYWGIGASPDAITEANDAGAAFRDIITLDKEHILREIPCRARWVCVVITKKDSKKYIRVTTTYKHATTHMRVSDSSCTDLATTAYNANGTAVRTMIFDGCGNIVGSSGTNYNTSIMTTLSDNAVNALFTVSGALGVGVYDTSNSPIGATGVGTVEYREAPVSAPLDIVIMLERSEDMGSNLSGDKKFSVAYRNVIKPVADYIYNHGGFSQGRLRFSVVYYDRQEITSDTFTINGTSITIPNNTNTEINATHNDDISEFGQIRSYIPGLLEFSSKTDVLDTINRIFTTMNGIGVGQNPSYIWADNNGTSLHKLHYVPSPKTPVLQPGKSLYTTLDRVVTNSTNGSTPAGAGNLSYLDSNVNDPKYIAQDNTLQPVLISIGTGVISDDKEYVSSDNGFTGYRSDESTIRNTIYNSAQTKMRHIFGDNIYAVVLDVSSSTDISLDALRRFVDPCATVLKPTSYYMDAGKILTLGERTLSAVTLTASGLIDRVLKSKFEGHDAMKGLAVDANGAHQASTDYIQDATFGGVGLYYALSDKSCNIITTTQIYKDTSYSTAMTVHQVNATGRSIDKAGGDSTPINFISKAKGDIHTFDMSVGGAIRCFTDLSNNSFVLRNIGIANESATTTWIKVYDMSYGANTTPTEMATKSKYVVMNIAVPQLSYRDIPMIGGVQFNNGLHFRAAVDYTYDCSYRSLGKEAIYVTGSYSDSTHN